MSGRRSTTASSPQPPANVVQTPSDWCADCWSEPKDTCHDEKHSLQEFDAAEKSAEAEALALERVLARVKGRLRLLAEGRARAARAGARPLKLPVIRAFCPGGGEGGFEFKGGDVYMTLAVTKPLSASDKGAICRALEDVKLTYDRKTHTLTSDWCFDVDDEEAAGSTPMVPSTRLAVDKFEDCFEGQPVAAGTVILVDGSLQVHFKDTRFRGPRYSQHVKVFGTVTSGLDSLEGRGCQGGCFGMDGADCYCVSGIIWHECIFLNRLKFVD